MDRTALKGYIRHPDPDILVAYAHGSHEYGSIAEAERAFKRGEIGPVELEVIEEYFIENNE